jgi:hypothetical protein
VKESGTGSLFQQVQHYKYIDCGVDFARGRLGILGFGFWIWMDGGDFARGRLGILGFWFWMDSVLGLLL